MMVIDNRVGIQHCRNKRNKSAQQRAENFTMCYCGSRFETILEILKVQDKKIKELQLLLNELSKLKRLDSR